MHFDDRLATVLRHRASGERAARTQFRQLLDLLGRQRHGRDESLLAAAWLRLGALNETIPAADRVRMIDEPGWRFENAQLAAHFAEDAPAVAAAALGRARLSEEDWEVLIPRLPVRARGFLRLRRDLPEGAVRILDRLGVRDRALPLPQHNEPLVLANDDEFVAPSAGPESAQQQELDRSVEATPQEASPEPTAIAALVERIEAFQRNRSGVKGPQDRSALAQGDPPLPFIELERADTASIEDSIAFTTDGEGRIDWTEEKLAPMLRFLLLTDHLDLRDRRAMRSHLPLSNVAVSLEGAPAIAGTWYLDAAPRFDPFGGRFIGYAGRFRREDPSAYLKAEAEENDRIRQLLHELRTPVNAIQGFAEVIQQQLFGPVPHEYRALAATVAGDAARILAGFEELDRLAKLETGARELDMGEADLSAIVAQQVAQLGDILAARDAGFSATIAPNCRIAISASETEGLSWRILAALAASMAPGETCRLALTAISSGIGLECQLPAALRDKADLFSADALKAPASGRLSAGAFGTGFALRLARAEARSAGGSLAKVDDALILTLPPLTTQSAEPSPTDGSFGAAQPNGS